MTWVGIDYDTQWVHLVRLPEVGLPTYHPCRLEGDHAFDRIRRVPLEMPGPGFWEAIIAAGIEEPGGRYALGKLKGVQGAILACLPEDLLVQPYQAPLWKKLIGIGGGATKEQVQAWVLSRLEENPGWPQDAYDAYCLAYVVSRQVVEG